MKYYHATAYTNLASILSSGINRGIDGCVYFTTQPNDAAKFAYCHGVIDIIVFEIELTTSENNKVFETFDHNKAFFKCRSFAIDKDIHPNRIKNIFRYNMTNGN